MHTKITELVWSLVEPIVIRNGCEVWDVEYIREAGTWYLRLYIDKEGGVNIEDCEKISREVDPLLDEQDPIPGSYTFEVSSAGLERALKRPSDFEKFIGHLVEVKLYKGKDGEKNFIGTLTGYVDGVVRVKVGETEYSFEKNEIASVRLRIED